MYVQDFDDNGTQEQIITTYLEGKETIFADKRELDRLLPFIKRNLSTPKISLQQASKMFLKG